jgi:hypothetical protein
MACSVGTGITIAFATSTFTADVVDFAPIFEQSVEDVECTHQGSTAREFTPSELIDAGECTMSILFEPGVVVPVGAAPETITITFPFVTASTTKGNWACDGYIKSYSATATLEERMEGEVVIKWTGAGTLSDEA